MLKTCIVNFISLSHALFYSSVASTYALLAGSAYLHITQSSVRKKLNEDELKETLLDFLENSQNLEKNARSGVPMVPMNIIDKITYRQMKYYNIESDNPTFGHNFRIQVSPGVTAKDVKMEPVEIAKDL